jgi:hypothetical protein
MPKHTTGNLLRKTARGARDILAYSLSLPERSVRSLAALVGGGTSLLTSVLLPDSLRGTTTYRVTIGLFQDFLIEKVADMARPPTEQPSVKERFMQRKFLGNALEAAGLFTIHLSPLWVLAIAADAASGSKVFLHHLTERLKANGVLPPDAQPTELVEILEGVQKVSAQTALAIDQPPLSRAELELLAKDMQENYTRVLTSSAQLVPESDELWRTMRELASRENISLEQLMGVMTIDAANLLKKSLGTVTAVGQTGITLLDESVLKSYRRTLGRIQEVGFDTYVNSEFKPFLQAAKAHFSFSRKTRLEHWIRGD